MYKIKVIKESNSNKFRPAALKFEKSGYYTSSPPGTTAFMHYWDEEMRRCIHGYTTSDGEYITGYFYFYLNYSRIIKTEEVKKRQPNGRIKTIVRRLESFPRYYDYDKTYFDTIEEAEIAGKHLVVIKRRGCGYSFKGSAMMCRNFYCIPKSKSYAIASEAEFLVKDGLLTKAWEMMSFIDVNTAFGKKRQKKDTAMHKRASYVVDDDTYGIKSERGWGSEIMGITLKNDAQKARGKRGKLILWEEAGKFPNLKEAWQIARPSVEDGTVAFGLMVAYGSGGTEDADYEGLKQLFYEPDAYNALPIENVWDDTAIGRACGFFVPQYYNLEGADKKGYVEEGRRFMDENGNSDIEFAKKYCLFDREVIMTHSSDKTSIDRYISERPFNPEEATLQIHGNIFPKKDLIRHLSEIRNSEKMKNFKQVGDLYFDAQGKVKWEISTRLKDLTKYRLLPGDDPTGAIVIWEHPTDDPPYGLYIMGCLLPGEQVLTNRGLVNVEDVTLENKLINKDGDEVNINILLRYDKKNEPTYKVHMNNVDRPTIYTQEHPLYLSEYIESEFNFIKTKDAKEGMWTKYPNVYNKVKPIPFELWDKHKRKRKNSDINPMQFEDFWWFVGHWLGDGFNNKQKENYTIYNSFGLEETEYINKYKDIVTRIFSRNPHLKLKNGSNTHKFEYKQLYLFLEENFGKYAEGKHISEWVKYIPSHLKHHLILGYLDSDGSIYNDRNVIKASFKSINRKLLNDIQDILFSIGITSSFNLSSKPGTYNINGKIGLTKESYTIKLNQIELNKLANKYSFDYHSRKLRRAKQIEFKQKPKKSESCIITDDNNYIYIKIKKIESSVYSGIVYNFDCETHTFITQYCTGHNCDPYDHDQSGTNSLGSVIVYKRFQGFEEYYDLPVAEYTGRPETADQFYDKVRLLSVYYSAKILYENEKKGLFDYMMRHHCEYLLADQPDIIKDIVKNSTVTRGKGIHMTQGIKDWGEGAIKDWLIEEYAPGRRNLTKVFSEALLEELIAYNSKGNFDRCLVKGTNISVRDGFKKIEDIREGDLVLTHRGNFKRVTKLDEHVTNKDVLEFKTTGNYETLKATGNHPLYIAYTDKKKHNDRTKSLDNTGFVNADALNYKYQFALQPKRKLGKELSWPTKYYHDDNLMYLLGWYVSDGYVTGNQIKICLQGDQMEMALKLKSILNIYGEQEGKVYNGRQYIFKGAKITDKGTYISVTKGSEQLSRYLEDSGGKANNKQLSASVYNSPNTLMLAVGYLEGDGHQKKNAKYDGYKREIIEVSGIYEILIKQIRQILIDNGIWSSIRYIKARKENHNDQYSLMISRKYINKIAKHSLKFQEVNNINLVKKNYQYETEEGFWTPIKLIGVEKGNEKVYNFEVEEDHSYIASNIATHNCMSFMMVIIYIRELHHIKVKEKKEFAKKSLFKDRLFELDGNNYLNKFL